MAFETAVIGGLPHQGDPLYLNAIASLAVALASLVVATMILWRATSSKEVGNTNR